MIRAQPLSPILARVRSLPKQLYSKDARSHGQGQHKRVSNASIRDQLSTLHVLISIKCHLVLPKSLLGILQGVESTLKEADIGLSKKSWAQ